MSRLPLRVPLRPGEPADSVLHRLGTRWEMSRADFERFVGLEVSSMCQGAHAAAVARLIGVDGAALAASTPRRATGGRRMDVGSAWTDLSDMNARRLRVCGRCLEEDRLEAAEAGERTDLAAWCRPQWSVRSIATCTRHDVLLESVCRSCGRELDGANPAIDVCICGASMAGGAGTTFRSDVDRLLERAISDQAVPQAFAGVGLHQASSHLFRVGCMTRGWSARRPPFPGLEQLGAREAGLALVEAGPAALSDVLDGLLGAASPGPSGTIGLTSAYGWVWRSWLGVPTLNRLDLELRGTVLAHAEGNGVVSPRDEGDVTLTEACALLGAGHARTRRVAERTGMLGGSERRGVAMSIDAAKVMAVADTLEDLLDAKSASAMLGIGRQRFRELTRADLVAADPHALAIGAGRLFRPDGLADLVRRAAGDAPMIGSSPVDCVPVPRACRDASVSMAVLLDAMFEGRVHATARTANPGLAGVWVSVMEVRTLARAPSSIASAARRLGLHYEAARWLAAHGCLGIEPGQVDDVVVDAFADAYCTSAEAARHLGLSSRGLVRRLASINVRPSFGPPDCRQVIWRRDRLPKVIGGE